MGRLNLQTTPRLIPFRAEHMKAYQPRDEDYTEAVHNAREKERGGPAFSAEFEGHILGSAGIIIAWPGLGISWATLTDALMKTWPIWTTRVVKQILRETIRRHGLHRVELSSLSNNPRNIAWAYALGFTPEHNGIARMYTTTKTNVLRCEFVEGDPGFGGSK